MCTDTERTETQRHNQFQRQLSEQGMDTLQVVDTHSIRQEGLKDSVVQADTLLYTLRHRVQHSARHTCTPAFTSSPSTRVAVLEQFPYTDL